MSWNGGKIESIFKFEKNKYLDELTFISEEAKDAFYYGKWYLKVHGSCCAIDTKTGIPYQRVNLPNKEMPKNNMILNNGSQPSVLFKDEKCTHSYSWEPFKKPEEGSKKQKKLLDKVWEKSMNFIKDKEFDTSLVLVEFCGLKFQQTPGINDDIVIVEHLKQEFNTTLNDGIDIRDPILVKKYLSEHAIEGFICCNKDTNKRFKIRSNMMNTEKCLHELFHKHWIKNKNFNGFEEYIKKYDQPIISQ